MRTVTAASLQRAYTLQHALALLWDSEAMLRRLRAQCAAGEADDGYLEALHEAESLRQEARALLAELAAADGRYFG